jgi:carbon-monoxide dehydrogenase large subunit
VEQFGIGQPVRRKEDVRFITGKGQYTDDINLDGQAHGAILRSPFAHAEFKITDIAAAKAMPGVIAVYTVADADADGLPPIPCQVSIKCASGRDMYVPPRYVLAKDRVRFAGEPIAFVIAETRVQAIDATEAIEVDYEALPVITDTAASGRTGAAVIWPERPDNVSVHWVSHDSGPVDEAFAKAHKTVTVELVNNRVVGSPMEPRVAIGEYDAATDTKILRSPTQGVNKVRDALADSFFMIDKERIRVISPDTGGGFGVRSKMFLESILCLWAAEKLLRPVKWMADRQETFVCDTHGRDHFSVLEMAFDENAKILGMKAETTANVGAYLSDNGPRIPTVAGARVAGTVYDVPVMRHSVRVCFTNTPPTDAYRGAGRPEMVYQMERLLDVGADAMGLTKAEIRRRNFITPEQLPYTNQVGMVIDSGHFQETMEKSLIAADWDGFEARRKEAATRGKFRGIGMGYYIEASGGKPNEWARVALDPDATAQLYVGTYSHGQGHETAFSQILSEKLGIDFNAINFIQGDTDVIPQGNGTGGSRSSQMGGVAVARAADLVIEKAKKIAAHRLEAAASDIEFKDGIFSVSGTDLSLPIQEVARAAYDPDQIPEGEEVGLDEDILYQRDTECNFPNGCHISEVELDMDTGAIEVVSYTCVDDCGVIINPMLVAGQVHGGVAMGLGQALTEHTVFDPESGQFLTGSYMDYGMPRADNFPTMDVSFNVVRNPSNELGVKGIGEGGACGAPPALIGAIADALQDFGVTHMDMPVSSQDVWRILQSQKAAAE